ncbi:MarR family winged helix-turn-helix transcriptional regulator [Rubripirellula reticaptiva]|uniref:DNA-binding transcriptional repressor MarR n=1 Tax=Rubripirellula reticaptiva TaxID=2528013 RepID=A0A5C6F7V0_9BACT|nr:MarR family transcriptional regulator [Rubripirellula reticaptiva]TWU55839.1 DNA-binding transcriptional repressor MarR [Rubripirellula reticaptiva]
MAAGKLQDELKRKQPFASVEQEAILSLLRTGDQLENRLARFFREHDLTLSQFNLLRILQTEDREITCGEIAERMIQVVPAITGLVDRLERQGYVVRRRCIEDRRVVYVGITTKGIEMIQWAFDPLIELEKRTLKRMTRSDLKELIRLLEKTRASMEASAE